MVIVDFLDVDELEVVQKIGSVQVDEEDVTEDYDEFPIQEVLSKGKGSWL